MLRAALLLWVVGAAPTVQPDAGVKPLAVDNRRLFDDYATNEFAADKRYRNQILTVTGVLSAVETDETGGAVFRLVTRNQFLPTYAALETGPALKDDRIEKLAPGDKVIITCVGVGRHLGVPVLGGCVLQRAFRRSSE